MLPQKAIARLQEVKTHILAEPNNLMMSQWSRKTTPEYNICDSLSGMTLVRGSRAVELNPPCGTAACIAGWSCLLDPKWDRSNSPSGTDAVAILGLKYDGLLPTLFLVRRWPIRLQEEFATTDLRQRATAAAEAIDLWIAGDGQFNEQ